MSRIAYVNGRYVPHGQACVHIEDRGYQFADAVYEYFAVFGGRLADSEGHLERLWRSLGELRIDPPMASSRPPCCRRILAKCCPRSETATRRRI